MNLLCQLAGLRLPATFHHSHDIDAIRALRAAELIVAFVPAPSSPQDLSGASEAAQVLAVTRKGRVELERYLTCNRRLCERLKRECNAHSSTRPRPARPPSNWPDLLRRHRSKALAVYGLATLWLMVAPVPHAISASDGDMPRLPDLLQRPEQRSAWSGLLEQEAKVPQWVRELNVTSAPSSVCRVDAHRYVVGEMCKSHDCAANRFDGALSVDGTRIWGLLLTVSDTVDASHSLSSHANYRWLGNPGHDIRSCLTRLVESDPNWK